MDSNPITVCIIVRNEVLRLKEMLPRLSFAKEVVVIDNQSADDTAKLATDLGAKVISVEGDDFSDLRNAGLKAASTSWVLFLDADEELPLETKNEIIQIVNDPLIKFVGYRIYRETYFLGRQMVGGEIASSFPVRLAKKEAGKWKRRVHEVWQIKGLVGKLKNPLLHYTAYNLTDFLNKNILWAKLQVEANRQEGKRSSLLKVIFYPKAKFIKGYFFKGGYRDGLHGFVYAVIMAFTSFLSWGDLWVLQRKQTRYS